MCIHTFPSCQSSFSDDCSVSTLNIPFALCYLCVEMCDVISYAARTATRITSRRLPTRRVPPPQTQTLLHSALLLLSQTCEIGLVGSRAGSLCSAVCSSAAPRPYANVGVTLAQPETLHGQCMGWNRSKACCPTHKTVRSKVHHSYNVTRLVESRLLGFSFFH